MLSQQLNTFFSRVRLFAALPYAKRWALVRAWILLSITRVSLKLLPLPSTLRWLRFFSRSWHAAPSPDEVEARTVWAIDTINPFVSQATCLPRALTAQTLLAQAGLETALRVGVAKSQAGGLEAHAWLERDGRVVIGDLPDLQRYTLLPIDEIAFSRST